jgi:hypothetical protein
LAAAHSSGDANALEVLRSRYLKKDERGRIVETPAEVFARVATHVADVERRFGGDSLATADGFYEAMARLEFLPNSPALMNAGTRLGQLAACFVWPVDDSLEGIFNSLRGATNPRLWRRRASRSRRLARAIVAKPNAGTILCRPEEAHDSNGSFPWMTTAPTAVGAGAEEIVRIVLLLLYQLVAIIVATRVVVWKSRKYLGQTDVAGWS